MTTPQLSEADYLARLRDLRRRAWPRDVPTEPVYPFGEIPLGDTLKRWAGLQPDKAAIVFYGTTISYAALDRLSDRFAALLHRKGARPGDRVAVYLPTCPQFHIAFFGILKLGCVHVPVNPMFREHELRYELEDSGATMLVAQDQLMPLVRRVAPKLGNGQTRVGRIFVTSIADMLPAAPTLPVPEQAALPRIACDDALDLLPALDAIDAPPPQVAIDLDAVAALNYTGGTTGLPKGCVHTQRDMIYTAATACACGARQPGDISLVFQPVFWIAGENTALIFPVFLGETLIELTRWDPLAWMMAVDRYRVMVAGMVYDNAVQILDHPERERFDLRSLRSVRVSSFVKKLTLEGRRRWREATGTVLAEAAWGMTETHTSDTFTTGMQTDDADLRSRPVFCGLPVPGTELSIRSFEDARLMPLGEEGEIVVRTPSQLKSYWNKPDATASTIRDGWFYTGDIGMIDEEGYLHILGRRKEMLKVNGMSVFPSEIEALLGQHPAVIGSAVVGRDDAARGQAPVAFIMLDPARRARVDVAAMVEWCRANMAVYKVPEIRFVETLPMTATGKVKKEEVAQLL